MICCDKCQFYELYAEQRDPDSTIGRCHANPPVMPSDGSKFAKFPTVIGNMWCGLFEGLENRYPFGQSVGEEK